MQKKLARVLTGAGIALILSLTIFFAGIFRTETRAVEGWEPAFGVDVSDHNGTIDWNKAKADGVDFAIIRIGWGDDNVDGAYTQDDGHAIANMNGCEAAGIPYGVYIYSYAITEAEVDSEINHMLRMIQGRNPELGIWFDMEDADGYKNRHNFNPYTHGEQLTNFCVKFVEAIKARGYTKVGVYANPDYFYNVLDYNRISSVGFIWIAYWSTYNPPFAYAMWQYDDFGHKNGISTAVDMNKIYPDSPLYGIIIQTPPDEPDDEVPASSIIQDDGTVICRGDVNGDDKINVIDLAIIQKYILGKKNLEGDSFTLADVNGDGKINVIDLAKVQKHILGKINLFEISSEGETTTSQN